MLNVALLQMLAHGNDQAANLKKGEAFCRQAALMGADIALFPEMWNIGYTGFDAAQPGAREAWQAQAIGAQDDYVMRFRALARELGLAIALTHLERWEGGPRNTVALIDRRGEIVLTYAKVHLCLFDWPEAACTPGDNFPVCELETAQGVVHMGAMICYDREFPESARLLMLKGAEIILIPNACEMETNRLGQLRARAFENMVSVALANYAGQPHRGHSVAYDAMAFTADGSSRDTLIVEAGEAEGIHLAAFDLDALRAYRQHETWGNAFRRPQCYGPLASVEAVRPSFAHAEPK